MSLGIAFPLDERQQLSLGDYSTLEDYQAAVGGYVEAISCIGQEGLSFFANDEAKLIGLGINRRATLFWWLTLPPGLRCDFISGDAVLVGPTDGEGQTLNVPESIQHALFTATSYRLEVKVQGSARWHHAQEIFEDYFEALSWALDLANRRKEVERVRVAYVS
jgi:hypothetical protein